MVYEDGKDTISESEQNLRNKIRKRMIIGGLMLLALPLSFIVLIYGSNFIPSDIAGISMMLLILIGLVGFILLIYYAQGRSTLYRSLKMLHKIGPPNPIIVGKYAVLNKDPVYIIVPWGANLIYFVSFHHPERSFDQKTKVPGLIWKWEYKHRIGGQKVARKEGEFTIPIDVDTYLTGEGILYSLLMYNLGVVQYPLDFSAEDLNQIIESLISEMKNNGSDSAPFDESELQ
jgi:hypothetical protein